MPKIPTSQFRTRLSPDVPGVPTTPVSQAGIVERAQAGLAKEITTFAADIGIRRARSERDAFVDSESIDFAIDMQNIEAEEKLNFSGGNSKGLTKAVRTRAEENINQRLEAAPSSFAGDGFNSKAQGFLASKLARIQGFENQEIAKANRTAIRVTTSNIAFSQFQVPDSQLGLKLGSEHLKNIRNKVGNDITEPEAAILEAEARLKIASATIFGMVKRGQFEQANALIKSNYLKAFDAKSSRKLIDAIAGKHRTNVNDEIRLLREKERIQKEIFRGNEEVLLRELYVKAAAGESVEAEVIERIRSGEISTKKLNFIQARIMSPAEKERSEQQEFGFIQRLTGDEDLDDIRDDVISATNGGQLDAGTGGKLLKTIESRRKISPSDKQKIKLSDQLFKAKFPFRFFGTVNREAQKLHAEALLERDVLIEKGVDPIDATRAVIRRHKGSLESLPFIPGVPIEFQRNPIDNEKAIKRIIRDRLNSGQISKSEAVSEINLLEERKTAFEAQNFKTEDELLKEQNDKSRR